MLLDLLFIVHCLVKLLEYTLGTVCSTGYSETVTIMTFIPIWEEFEKSAEMLYLRDPINTRYSVKYSHSKGVFIVKITDNKKCLQYKTEVQQDVRKIDKFMSDLIRHMASNDNS